MLHDPQKKGYYQQQAKRRKLPNAYTAAIAEYMSQPHLKEPGDSSKTTGDGQKRV
jgi:hypothetical protein